MIWFYKQEMNKLWCRKCNGDKFYMYIDDDGTRLDITCIKCEITDTFTLSKMDNNNDDE